MKLIVYQGNDELLICTPKEEKKMMRTYFAKNMGRDKEEYDRTELNNSIFRILSKEIVFILKNVK